MWYWPSGPISTDAQGPLIIYAYRIPLFEGLIHRKVRQDPQGQAPGLTRTLNLPRTFNWGFDPKFTLKAPKSWVQWVNLGASAALNPKRE